MLRYIALILLTGTMLGAAEIRFERTEQTSDMKIGARKRVTPYTMIYARIQPYTLYENYLHEWIDRPLFLDSSLRQYPDTQLRGFAKDIEIAKSYNIDGFTMLANAYATRWRTAIDMTNQIKPEGFKLMGGLAWMRANPVDGKYPDALYNRYLDTIKRSDASPYMLRINGKVPYFTYVTMPPEQIREIRERLAKDGYENILLFDDIWLDSFAEFNRQKSLSPATREKLKEQLRAKLKVADGIVLANFHMYRDPAGDFTLKKNYIRELDEKETAPLLEEVYAEPAQAGKLLGLNIRHGYIGHMSGINEAELGTSQLRENLDTALLMNPDILSLVEWNEANENTSFQPTVCNSLSIQRIIRYYADFLKGLPPTPNPGDDTTIPNLIVSTRQTVRTGEKYRIELLNVPDSNSDARYSVQLILKDENGKLIREFAPDTFTVNKLTAVTYLLPSEELPHTLAVIPELRLKDMTVDTLQYTRLDPAVGWNFKEIRQPLRDLLKPSAVSFEVKPVDGRYQVSGSFQCAEPLASLELLDNEDEVYACDRENKFKLADHDLLLMKFFNKNSGKLRQTTITVEGVPDFVFSPWYRPYAGFGKWKKEGNQVSGDILYWNNGSAMLLAIPKNAPNAVLKLEIEGLGKHEYKIGELLKNGKNGFELPEMVTLRLDRMDSLADHPVPLDSNSARFTVNTGSSFDNPCFQLRAITRTGKIYRSKPVFTAKPSATEPMNVFSAYAHKMVPVSVPADLVTVINYHFTPDHGTVLVNPRAGCWNAQLGAGFQYLYPMNFGTLPKNAERTAPDWKKSGDRWALAFNGTSNYVVFPPETLPTGAFTLEFECRTDSTENQALFRHHSLSQGSLATFIAGGKLRASFHSMGRNYNGTYQELPVAIDFPVNEPVKVKVSYNLNEMVFSVNGKVQRIPFNLRAFKGTASIFGGAEPTDKTCLDHKLQFFKGELYSLRIRHNADF